MPSRSSLCKRGWLRSNFVVRRRDETGYVKVRPHDYQSEITLDRSTRGVRWVDTGHPPPSRRSGFERGHGDSELLAGASARTR